MAKSDRTWTGTLLVITLIAAAFFLYNQPKGAALTAQISVEGTLVAEIDLNKPIAKNLIEVEGPIGTSVIEVKPGAIHMKYSPCPDRICMNTGWIDRPGQVIACVPNRIIITVETAQVSEKAGKIRGDNHGFD